MTWNSSNTGRSTAPLTITATNKSCIFTNRGEASELIGAETEQKMSTITSCAGFVTALQSRLVSWCWTKHSSEKRVLKPAEQSLCHWYWSTPQSNHQRCFKIILCCGAGKNALIAPVTASYQHPHRAPPSPDICIGWALRFRLSIYLFVLYRCEESWDRMTFFHLPQNEAQWASKHLPRMSRFKWRQKMECRNTYQEAATLSPVNYGQLFAIAKQGWKTLI